MSVIVPSVEQVAPAIARLQTLGYRHRGDLGVTGREAFSAPTDLPPHNLYLGTQSSLALRNHLALRDFLWRHPDRAAAYAALKRELAERYQDDIDGYTDGKTDAILAMLKEAGFAAEELRAIERINRRSG